MTTSTSDSSPGLEAGVGVKVVGYSDLPEDYLAFLARANLAKFGELEAWTVLGSNFQINYSTHGVYRYFGKFPAPIAAHLISMYTKPGDLVIDPACGSGTTGVEALLLGRRAELFDVNPLSVLISRVKTRWVSEDRLQESLRALDKRLSRIEADPFQTDEIDLKHWFLDDTIQELSKLRKAIMQEKSLELREFLTMVFASIIRRVSKATTQQGRLFLDVETAEKDVMPRFRKSAIKAAERLGSLPTSASVKVQQRSLLSSESESEPVSNLVIYHPPYFNAYKYTSINSLEMAWLDLPRRATRSSEIREFFKVGKPENAGTYVEDIVITLENIRRHVKRNGVVAMMIGDALMKEQHIDVTARILDQINDVYSIEKVALRVPKFTEATWASSQRRGKGQLGITMYDYVVILRAR